MTDNDLGAYSIAEFAHLFNMCRARICREIKLGRLKVAKIGSRTIITRRQAREYQAFIEAESESNEAREAAAERSRAKAGLRRQSAVA